MKKQTLRALVLLLIISMCIVLFNGCAASSDSLASIGKPKPTATPAPTPRHTVKPTPKPTPKATPTPTPVPTPTHICEELPCGSGKTCSCGASASEHHFFQYTADGNAGYPCINCNADLTKLGIKNAADAYGEFYARLVKHDSKGFTLELLSPTATDLLYLDTHFGYETLEHYFSRSLSPTGTKLRFNYADFEYVDTYLSEPYREQYNQYGAQFFESLTQALKCKSPDTDGLTVEQYFKKHGMDICFLLSVTEDGYASIFIQYQNPSWGDKPPANPYEAHDQNCSKPDWRMGNRQPGADPLQCITVKSCNTCGEKGEIIGRHSFEITSDRVSACKCGTKLEDLALTALEAVDGVFQGRLVSWDKNGCEIVLGNNSSDSAQVYRLNFSPPKTQIIVSGCDSTYLNEENNWSYFTSIDKAISFKLPEYDGKTLKQIVGDGDYYISFKISSGKILAFEISSTDE